jgi:hypothetical protein
MQQLNAFCDAVVLFVLWRGNGRYAALFVFLALRFLAQEDSVLNCEGVHAQWQWIALHRRGRRVGSLNGVFPFRTFAAVGQ